MTKKILTSLGLLLTFLNVNSQTLSGGSTILSEISPDWHLGVTAEALGEFALPANVKNAIGGDMGVYTAEVNVKAQGAWQQKHFLTLSLDYAYDSFDFSSANAPFSSINRTYLTGFYLGRIAERWSVFAYSNLGMNAEGGESVFDGAQLSAGAGVSYMFTRELQIGFGAGAYSRLDDDWLGMPIVFINWQITEKLKLTTFAGAALYYDVFGDESLILAASVEYKNRYYRLADNALGQKRSARDSYVQSYVGATYNFTKNAYITASVGANFGRDIRMRTDKHSAEKIEADAAPSFIIHLGYRF